jgi:hypothetical protein
MQGMAAARAVARNGPDEATRLATLHEIAAHLLGAPSRREEPA